MNTPSEPSDEPGVDANAEGRESTRSRSREPSRSSGMRYAAMGTELASYTLTFAAIGYAIDWYRGHAKPYATAAATLIGFVYGMFRFIVEVQRVNR
ncbi:MAG: AtpZ/AtpI family protein [Planctomycetota bacterium]